MEIIDISMTVAEKMPVYKNRIENSPLIKTVSNHQEEKVHQSRIDLDLHTGTHIDAPLHMIADGETAEVYGWEKFITSCKVLDLTDLNEKITVADLEQFRINENEFLLLKTQNSYKEDFTTNFIYLAKGAAKYLAAKKIKGVGIDSLGIERAQPGHPTHKTLLKKKIIILEGLRLGEVAAGKYKLLLLPLKIKSVEALPARAILIP